MRLQLEKGRKEVKLYPNYPLPLIRGQIAEIASSIT